MFVLSKLISRLLFPAALIIELLLAGLIFIGKNRRRTGFSLCSAALTLFVSASMHPVADFLLWTLEGRYKPIGEVTHDLKNKIKFILVLGAGHSERDGLSDTARITPSATGRVIEAVRLSREFPAVPIIFTGGSFPGELAVGETASLAAIKYGLPPSRAIVEGSGLNTEGEARAVRFIVKDNTVLLVTSASHMKRAMEILTSEGINAVPAPSDYQAMGGPYTIWNFIPSAEAMQKTERAWYEYMGLAWNAVRR